MAKKHGFLPHAEIYDNLRNKAEIFLIQKLWMIDTESYIEQNTKTNTNMFKSNANKSIATLLKDVCPRLKSLHYSGYIHGDIKASNICMDWDKKEHKPLKFDLIDFEFIEKQGKELKNKAFGTAGYYPPEMVVKDKLGVIVTDKFDIYSLGITLFELVNGCHPYWGKLREKYSMEQLCNGEYYDYLTPRFTMNMIQGSKVLKKKENWDLKHLIYNMVLVNSIERFDIDDIMNDKWYRKYCMSEMDESNNESEEKINVLNEIETNKSNEDYKAEKNEEIRKVAKIFAKEFATKELFVQEMYAIKKDKDEKAALKAKHGNA